MKQPPGPKKSRPGGKGRDKHPGRGPGGSGGIGGGLSTHGRPGQVEGVGGSLGPQQGVRQCENDSVRDAEEKKKNGTPQPTLPTGGWTEKAGGKAGQAGGRNWKVKNWRVLLGGGGLTGAGDKGAGNQKPSQFHGRS